eukprot:8194305-Pyramimonas_sp.AAC.1
MGAPLLLLLPRPLPGCVLTSMSTRLPRWRRRPPGLCCSHRTYGPHPRNSFEHPEKCRKSVEAVPNQRRT